MLKVELETRLELYGNANNKIVNRHCYVVSKKQKILLNLITATINALLKNKDYTGICVPDSIV